MGHYDDCYESEHERRLDKEIKETKKQTAIVERLRGLAKAEMFLGAYTEAKSITDAADEIERLRAKLEKIEKKMREAPRLIAKADDLTLTNMDAIEMEIGVPYVLVEYKDGQI